MKTEADGTNTHAQPPGDLFKTVELEEKLAIARNQAVVNAAGGAGHVIVNPRSFLDGVPRVDSPEQIDLTGFSRKHRDRLAQVALWITAEEKDLRQVAMIRGTSKQWTEANITSYRRIILSVLIGDVAGVLREVEEQAKAAATYESEKF